LDRPFYRLWHVRPHELSGRMKLGSCEIISAGTEQVFA
jgi:hypothetical protein